MSHSSVPSRKREENFSEESKKNLVRKAEEHNKSQQMIREEE
jgi:hypothetical protein